MVTAQAVVRPPRSLVADTLGDGGSDHSPDSRRAGPLALRRRRARRTGTTSAWATPRASSRPPRRADGQTAVGQQIVGPSRRRAPDRSRHGPNRDPAADRGAHPYERAPLGVALDHHYHVGQAGQDPVAHRELPGRGGDADRLLREERSRLGHPLTELGVASGIGRVEPTGHDSYRWAAPRWQPASRRMPPRALRSRSRSPSRTGRRRRGRRQLGAELGRYAHPLTGSASGSHHRHPAVKIDDLWITESEQHGRRLGVGFQGCGIPGIPENPDANTQGPVRLPNIGNVDPPRPVRHVCP